jgi:hypothetical protein
MRTLVMLVGILLGVLAIVLASVAYPFVRSSKALLRAVDWMSELRDRL